MFEKLLHLDKQILVYLNNLGSETFDPLWLLITKQLNWLPLFLFLVYIVYKKLGTKNLGIIMLYITLILVLCNTSVELCKHFFQRLRPINDPEINHSLRIIHRSKSFSFFSGHAANSTATMTFLFLVLKKHYKYVFLVFLFPLIFAYSRIYLGLHFPTDILTGYTFGALFGYSAYYFYNRKVFFKH